MLLAMGDLAPICPLVDALFNPAGAQNVLQIYITHVLGHVTLV